MQFVQKADLQAHVMCLDAPDLESTLTAHLLPGNQAFGARVPIHPSHKGRRGEWHRERGSARAVG